ncbi:hypothetical protein [Acidianus bottle-shaped virus 3 strain ABV3]|uniref:Uncharacterized protein n=1 Tax=Acidianus bottle-shaped virus 3 strain ABV3 TaxID=1732174 RepID=A0A0N9P4M5_9VIRU|nr:hypothetical protein AVU00_gp65 [Acidianus bottle-shaped virus 3 strain ABV3]ALG96867.1 hypothetical protein [Acidianus bottle-shaped virus 3 strain ABV3]
MRKQVKNFKDAVRLAMAKDQLGCDLIHLYEGSNPTIDAYIQFLTCVYCYEYCHPQFDQCVEATRILYHNRLINLTEFRTVLGKLLALKKRGYLK